MTNTGHVAVNDVVLGSLTPRGADTNGMPLTQLFGFERVHLQPGETKNVYLYPDLECFTQVGADGTWTAVAGGYRATFGVAETAERGMGLLTYAFSVVQAARAYQTRRRHPAWRDVHHLVIQNNDNPRRACWLPEIQHAFL